MRVGYSVGGIRMAISKELKKTYSKRRHQESKETWKDYFTLFCECLIDSDSSDSLLEEKVKKSAELADLALQEMEDRWIEQ